MLRETIPKHFRFAIKLSQFKKPSRAHAPIRTTMPSPSTYLFILVRNGERELGMVTVRAKLKAVPAGAEDGEDDRMRIVTVLSGFIFVLRRNPCSCRDPTIQERDALASDVVEIEKTSEELPQHAFIDLAYVDADFADALRAKIAAMDLEELWCAFQNSGDPSFPLFVEIADVPFKLTGSLRAIIMYSIKTFIVIRLILEKKGMPIELAQRVARECEPLAFTRVSALLGH